MFCTDIPLPDWLDWDMWKVLSSDKFNVTLKEMEEYWSIDDLQKALLTLHTFEELEYRRNKNQQFIEKHRNNK